MLRRQYINWVWLVVMLAMLVAAGCRGSDTAQVRHLPARQAATLIDRHNGDPQFVIIDVRTPAEYQQGHIAGARLMDYYGSGFQQSLEQLDRAKAYFFYCRSGNRSGRTMNMIADMGFKNVYHLEGGIMQWQAQGLPLVKTP